MTAMIREADFAGGAWDVERIRARRAALRRDGQLVLRALRA